MANPETEVMRRALLETTRATTLLRNNVGAYETKDGWVKYGVGGKGGSDTVGWTSKVVTQAMVGQRVAVFTAVEFKAPGRDTTKPDRRAAQDAFIQAVVDAGGLAGYARSTEDVWDIIA